jgi:hypothetical protein
MVLASLSRDAFLLMLAAVALFPVVLLALLLITSGLERRVGGSGEEPGSRE